MKTPFTLPRLSLFASLVFAPFLGYALTPTDVFWDGTDAGLFGTATNWTDDTLPGNTNRAVINSGGPTVILGASNPMVAGLSLASGFTLSRSDTDTVNRTLSFQSATNGDRYDLGFNNAGTIASGGTSGSLLIDLSVINTTNFGEFVNAGTIEASAGTTLTISKSGLGGADGVLSNFADTTLGTLKTSGSGTLTFTGDSIWNISGGNLINAAGTLNFLTRARANFTDVVFTNGGTANFEERATNNSGGNGFTLSGTTALTNTGTLNLTRDTTQNTYGTASSVTISSAVATTSINNSGTINIRTFGDTVGTRAGAGFEYTSVAQTLTNTGTINLESQSTLYDTYFSSTITAGNGLTIEGNGGEIVMKVGTGGSVDRVLITGSNGAMTQSAGHTIRGAGNFGAGQLFSFTNNGTVLADDPTYALTIDPRNNSKWDTGTGRFFNNGTLRASGAGGLILNDGQYTNDGIFKIDAGSSLTQNGGLVLTNKSGRALDIQGTWLSGASGGGLIKNSGDISYNSAADSINTIGLTGTGRLIKDGTGSLTLNGANTLKGGTVINDGTLIVNAGTGGTFTATTKNGNYNVTTADTSGLVVGQAITGTGIMGGLQYITGIYQDGTTFTMSSNASSSQTDTSLTVADFSALGTGAVTINGGKLQLGTGVHTVSSVALNAGTLAGTGTLNGLVTTGGVGSMIAPGNSPGTLTLAGGLDASAGVTFDFELGSVSDLVDAGLNTGGLFTGSTADHGLVFNITDAGGLAEQVTYTLLVFDAHSGLDYTDLALSSGSISAGIVLDNDFGVGGFLINDQSLQVQFSAISAVIPETSSFAILLGAAALGFVGVCRQSRKRAD